VAGDKLEPQSLKSGIDCAVSGSGQRLPAAIHSPNTTTQSCTRCGSERLWRDGLRYSIFGDKIQRWLCRNCGLRFSDSADAQKAWSTFERLQRVQTKPLRMLALRTATCQIGATETKEAKNLAEVIPKEVAQREGTPNPETIRGKLVEFAFWMQKQGYADETTRNYAGWVKHMASLGANLWNPDSIKEVLAKQQKWSNSFKMLLMYAYESFMKMESLTWIRPRYKQDEKLSFIPMEQELDQLISATSKVLGTFLLGLKDTGADPGELTKLKWIDVNYASRTVTISPVKSHNARVLPVSQQFIDRLNQLPKKSESVFPLINTISTRFFHQRKSIASKLNNPRLMKISFRTFRHWKGTLEYHRTKDILIVKKILGHKSIQNTLKYIDLEANLFGFSNDQFTARVANNAEEACKLVEVGFEYVTGEYHDGGKIFRKRK